MQKKIRDVPENITPDADSAFIVSTPTSQSRRVSLRNARKLTYGELPAAPEGVNAAFGLATLVDGTVVVTTSLVNENSRIQLTAQENGTFAGNLRVFARVPGISFTISSTNNTDTCDVAWELKQP